MPNKIRSGKVLVFMAILMPAFLGIAALVFDAGTMFSDRRDMQHVADATALATAMEIRQEKEPPAAAMAGEAFFNTYNGLEDADIEINIPPNSGPFATSPQHVEVVLRREYFPRFFQSQNGNSPLSIEVRSVAGIGPVTDGAAMVALNPDPSGNKLPILGDILPQINAETLVAQSIGQVGLFDLIDSVPIVGPVFSTTFSDEVTAREPGEVEGLMSYGLTSYASAPGPAIIGGLEVEGNGILIVDGAIHVNARWGGRDENGEVVGMSAGPPYGIATMPLISTTSMQAKDIRVVGGVDYPERFTAIGGVGSTPLQANRLPVPDPFADLPIPSSTVDTTNVKTALGVEADLVRVVILPAIAQDIVDNALSLIPAASRPLLSPILDPLVEGLTTAEIQPGVYHSITLIDLWGGIKVNKGIYVIRGNSDDDPRPLTIIGPVQAEGVMFYITDSPTFDASTGLPDSTDNPDIPNSNILSDEDPSALVLPLLSNANISGLNDPNSPFDGFLIYQRRIDPRPVVVEVAQNRVRGTIYGRWANLEMLGGGGTNDVRIVTGTIRVILMEDTRLTPQELLPPAEDALLLE